MTSLQKIIEKSMKPLLKNKNWLNTDLQLNWVNILGPHLGENTKLVKITNPNRWHSKDSLNEAKNKTTTLTIKVNPYLALEIQHQTYQFIDKINTYYGFQLVDRLIIQQGIVHNSKRKKKTHKVLSDISLEEKYEKTLEKIHQPLLKEKLSNLAKAIQKKEEKDKQ